VAIVIEYATEQYGNEDIYDILVPEIETWFRDTFGDFTACQRYAVKEIHDGKNTLISSPTGSGKTLSAFLAAINELLLLAKQGELEDKIYVLYVSPLKALNNDIERNLQKPLRELYEANDIEDDIRVGVRTGDTSQKERQEHTRNPPHIYITTPESLAIVLNSPKFSRSLEEARYIIVDEIHSLADNKRGVHLSLSLERLVQRMNNEPVRIGLSATISPMDDIARFLVGTDRDCLIVDVTGMKDVDIEVISPVDDLVYTPAGEASTAMYEILDNLIQQHQTTLVFTNTRSATERVVFNLKQRYPRYDGVVEAHHGSLSRDVRLNVEEKLKRGDLRCVVSSTSLELGIDIGSVDLVVLLGSPKSVTRALQRIGRSGHFITETSKGRVIVLDRDDLIECTVLAREARQGRLDRVHIPSNAIDVLAQHVVGMGIQQKWDVGEALQLIQGAYPYRDLPRQDFIKLLHYLAGEYEELEGKKVYGKIWYDEQDEMFGRRGKMVRPIYYLNIGTIPDETAVKVYTTDKQFVGKVEEPFVERLKKDDIFVLAGQTYQFKRSRRMRIYVVPRPDASPTIPSWFSEQLPLSYDLAREISRYRRTIAETIENGDAESLMPAIRNYFQEQLHFGVPHDQHLLVETFRQDGYQHNVFHTLVGRQANDALSRIVAYRLTSLHGFNIRLAITDNGFDVMYPERHDPLTEDDIRAALAANDMRDDLRRALDNTEMLKRRFRHVAARSFMILRNYLGHHMSVSRQQRNASVLFRVVKEIDPEFPALKETYREIMEDSMDIDNAVSYARQIEQGDIELSLKQMDMPSPFAFNIVAVGASDVVLMEDRKAFTRQMHEQVMEAINA